MAVNNISPVATYIANGITSEFSFSFKIINNTDVKLFVDNVELNYSTDYTVNILTSILTTVAIPASGAVVILQRDTTLNRDIDYTEGGGLSSSTLDNDLDKTTLLIQDQFERSLKRDVGSNNYNVNNNNIINVGTPTTPTDAANKAYVDSVGGGGVGGGVTDHTLLTSIGTNSHAVIDTHIADTSIHYSQASISITESQISDLGSYEPSFTKNTAFNNNYGTTVGTVTQGNDSRLSDARTPTAHTHTESDITDLGSYVASTDATNIVALSQVAYDALTPNANTMYLIV